MSLWFYQLCLWLSVSPMICTFVSHFTFLPMLPILSLTETGHPIHTQAPLFLSSYPQFSIAFMILIPKAFFALFSFYSVNLSLFFNHGHWEHWFSHPVSYFPSPGDFFSFQIIIFMFSTTSSLEKSLNKFLQLILPYITLLLFSVKALPTMVLAGTFTTQHLLFSQT